MRLCDAHVAALEQALDDRGLTPFVARGTKKAGRKIEQRIAQGGGLTRDTFDPLIAATLSIYANAVDSGAQYLLTPNPAGTNDGHYCPICEALAHGVQTEAWWCGNAADEQLQKARALGLVGKPS